MSHWSELVPGQITDMHQAPADYVCHTWHSSIAPVDATCQHSVGLSTSTHWPLLCQQVYIILAEAIPLTPLLSLFNSSAIPSNKASFNHVRRQSCCWRDWHASNHAAGCTSLSCEGPWYLWCYRVHWYCPLHKEGNLLESTRWLFGIK